MANKEYCARIVDTQKAFKYIRRKGFLYVCDWIACGDKYIDHILVSCEDQKAREHIMNTYPNSMVSFCSEVSILNEYILRENAWKERLAEIA